MRAGLKTLIKKVLLASVSRLTGRHAVLLPNEARDEESILAVHAPYRVEGRTLGLEVLEPNAGLLAATLLGFNGHFPTRALWDGPSRPYPGPCRIVFDPADGSVALGDAEWGRAPVPLPGRRFAWRLSWTGPDGWRKERLTGHYVPVGDRAVEGEYFQGENYVDHEAQSAGDHAHIVGLLKRHRARGPVLEVGCATGGLLAALDAAGLPSVGVDASDWAVTRAGERLGRERVWVCDVEHEPLPPEIKARGPFGAIVLAAVFEHFSDPFGVLAALTSVAAPRGLLVITTTNAGGLSRALFGGQWEGHFDWTHRGIDLVSAESLRDELPRLGWRIAELVTHWIWDASSDPTRATLREWWAADARFRRLLGERELGDLITCVAVRE
jgi:2-polyprenyl-3-methyl-5-hydroxy-6-metoxy-1,4-benzoquinol methylase